MNVIIFFLRFSLDHDKFQILEGTSDFLNILFQISAATCDFLTIVKELLQSGADISIADSDGCQPIDIAESSAVKELIGSTNQDS